MTTQEVLTFLKELGINFSVWRLNHLVKRGVLKEPPKIFNLSNRSPRLWSMNDVKRVKLFVMLEVCKKRR